MQILKWNKPPVKLIRKIISSLCVRPVSSQVHISNIRYVALGVPKRFYKDADAKRRRNLIESSINDSLCVKIIHPLNQTLTCNPEHETCRFDLSNLLDVEAITAGMPPKYAEVLEELLPRYYSRFRDKQLLVISYLRAECPPCFRPTAWGRILLETQLIDLNRRLDQVDPTREYRRYSPFDAYRYVIINRVIWHCVRSLFGLNLERQPDHHLGEAKAIGRATKEDRQLEAELEALRK